MSLDDFDDEVTLEEPDDDVGGPLHWPALEGDALDQAQADLTVWVEALCDRFNLPARTIPACWNRHNAAVEALQGLRDFERGSYCDDAQPTAGVDFLRALRDVTEMLTDWAATTGCTSRHSEPVAPRTWTTDPAGWAAVDRAPSTYRLASV